MNEDSAMKILTVLFTAIVLNPLLAGACGIYGLGDIFSKDPKVAAASVVTLRDFGETGLRIAMNSFEALPPMSKEENERCRAVIDQVAKQKDAKWSGLFWYTDFDRALEVAKAGNRPILSLRLLGNLDEELSCANSRFFRTVLYPDEKVSKFLRENFVLHWKSVRPVPKLTVDFGNGRKLERTITGNSAHYILNSDGAVIDVLPGLYSAEAFLGQLEKSKAFFDGNREKSGRDWVVANAAWHRESLKAAVVPVVVQPLGGNAKAIIKDKLPAKRANALSVSKFFTEDPVIALFEKKVRNLEKSIAEDTARNENNLHRAIHGRLADADEHLAVDALNAWVYAELFETPDSDPWLGLLTEDYYTGIKNDGAVTPFSALALDRSEVLLPALNRNPN
jgi:hypothetical protein